MKYLVDSHTHTVVSGHAYNTMQEMALAAKAAGLQALGITEHAPTIPGTCHPIYFANYHVVDRFQYGIELLLGVELNIINYEGELDLPASKLKYIDVGIASIHPGIGREPDYPPYIPGSVQENTRAYLKAMENPIVDIIGHPDDIRISLDYEALVQGAKANRVLLEVNATSLKPKGPRGGAAAAENIKTMLSHCEKLGVPVIVDSDAHYVGDVARFDAVEALLQELRFPEELVVNRDLALYKGYLHKFRQG